MALGFVLLGAFLLYQSLQLSMRSLDGGPGPGLLPAMLAVLLIVLASRVAIGDPTGMAPVGNLRRIGVMAGGLAAHTAILEAVGFVTATALLMVLLMLTFNERARLPLVALGLVGTAASYWLFHTMLQVQLPADPWGVWR